jgi:hypothetical protein
VFGTNIQPKTDVGCQLLAFAVYVGYDICSMTVVLTSCERALTVTQPLKAKSWLTKSRIIRVWSSLVIFFVLVNGHLFWTMHHDPDAEGLSAGETYAIAVECRLRTDTAWQRTIGTVWYYVDFCLYAGIPVVVIIIANLTIIVSVRSSHNRRLHMQASEQQGQKKGRFSQLTAMLFLMSSIFVVCCLPVIIFPFVADSIFPNADTDLETFCLAYLTNAILGMFVFINYAINFALYCLGGAKFRNALKQMFFKTKSYSSTNPDLSLSSH